MFEYPDFIANILGIAVIGLGIFSVIVMVVVFQAALAAKEYYDRQNREFRNRPTVFDRARDPSRFG